MKKRDITSYEQAVEYLYGIPRFASKNTMESTKAYLAHLGNPDKELKIIHVAGTNGKGSVCAYLRSVLETAGYRVALFTSPHLVDVRERFVIDQKMVEKEEFLQAFLQIYEDLDWEALEKGEGYHPTFFEYLFFMAMLLFSAKRPDFCVLETGLGGRLDATNAVEQKELCVITEIGMDHTQYLGDTLEKIAFEKAGIMKKGVPVVFADTKECTKEVFLKQASTLGIPCYSVSKKDYTFLNFHHKTIDFSMYTEYYGYITLTLRTLARYQMENASLAVRALEQLDEGRTISLEDLKKGIEKCSWAGRMEEILPEVFVDGAHNEDGVNAFLETVREDNFQGRRTLLFSAVQDKAYQKMLWQICASGLFQKIVLTHLHTERAADIQSMLEGLPKTGAENNPFGQNISVFEQASEALESIRKKQTDDERVYIAGSLYLVGEIKQLVVSWKE